MDFRKVSDFPQALEEGRYRVRIIQAEAKFSNGKNVPMIGLKLEVVEGDRTGHVLYDNLITDPSNGGARYAKKKLKGLAPELLENEFPDSVASERLLDLIAFADVERTQQMGLDTATQKYTVPQTELDAEGRTVKVWQNNIKAYYRVSEASAAPQAHAQPQTMQAPPQGYSQAPVTQYAAQPQQYQGQMQQAPQGFAGGVQGGMQFAPPPQQQYAPQGQPMQAPPQAAMPGYAPPVQYQQAPQGYAQQTQQGVAPPMFQNAGPSAPNGQVAPQGGEPLTPWVAAQATGAQAPVEAAANGAGGGKRGKKA